MGEVVKTVNGIKYLYFQNKVPGKEKVITTYIGRADLTGDALASARTSAMIKHGEDLLSELGALKTVPYHFENKPSPPFDDVNLLEMIRVTCQLMRSTISSDEMHELDKTIFIKYVQGTTAIEGNTFSENETARLLLDELTTANKTVNETLEIANYNDVREFLQTRTGDVTESLIKRTHLLLMKGIKGKGGKQIKGGEYRTAPVLILGAEYTPPPSGQISDQMRYALSEYQDGIQGNVHPVELAATFHLKLEQIHPFEDGNGRVGREILNYMLTRSGHPSIYITPKQRSEYLTSLQEGDKGNLTPIVDFVIGRIAATFAYIQGRTSIFSALMSPEFAAFHKELVGDDLYRKYSEELGKVHEANDLP